MTRVWKDDDAKFYTWKEGEVGTRMGLYPLFKCPQCKGVGIIDEEQFHGKVSIQCPFAPCTYHETKDWAEVKYVA